MRKRSLVDFRHKVIVSQALSDPATEVARASDRERERVCVCVCERERERLELRKNSSSNGNTVQKQLDVIWNE